MTAIKTLYPAGELVRITDPTRAHDYGATYEVARVGTRKGVRTLFLNKPGAKQTDRNDADATSGQVMRVSDLFPDLETKLDAAVAEREAKQAEWKREYEQRSRRADEEQAAAELAEGRALATATPVREREWISQSEISAELAIYGPEKPTKRDPSKTYRDRLYVSISTRERGWGTPRGPVQHQVNWSASGSVSPTVARAYARLILAAADAAEALEIPQTETVEG